MIAVAERSERIYLKDPTCPLIRLDKLRRRDKSVGFSVSLLLHGFIFVLVGVSLIKPSQFGIDKGFGSIEVNLVAASEPTVQVQLVEPPPVETKSDFVGKKEVNPEVKEIKQEEIVKIKGKDQVTAQSTGGVISEAKPDYLKNPAPDYPEVARRRGYEGTVLLKVNVDKNGTALSVEIEKSSGRSALDKSAIKAVKKWLFSPARLGSIPVESFVYVPIKFALEQ